MSFNALYSMLVVVVLGQWCGSSLAWADGSTSPHLTAAVPVELLMEDPDTGLMCVDPQEFSFEKTSSTPPSGYISEETPPASCSVGKVVTGIDCDGSYCDNVKITCSTLGTYTFTTRTWLGYFTDNGSTTYKQCSTGYAMTGFACRGSYCDDVAIECTYTGMGTNGCIWSGYFSEEDPPFVAPSGTYIRGIQCSGSYCNDMRYYTCKP